MCHATEPESHTDTVGRVSPARRLKPQLSQTICDRAESKKVALCLQGEWKRPREEESSWKLVKRGEVILEEWAGYCHRTPDEGGDSWRPLAKQESRENGKEITHTIGLRSPRSAMHLDLGRGQSNQVRHRETKQAPQPCWSETGQEPMSLQLSGSLFHDPSSSLLWECRWMAADILEAQHCGEGTLKGVAHILCALVFSASDKFEGLMHYL